MIPELENAVLEIERTIEILRGKSSFGKREALFKIGEVCHPKALGDVAVSDPAWHAQLDKLYDTCARAFNRLEKDTG